MAFVTNGVEETNGWCGVVPFDISFSFSFGAVCKAAVGRVNQVVNIMGVAVENLHICTPAMDLRAPAEADSASNLSLNNSGVHNVHPDGGVGPTVFLVGQFGSGFSSYSEPYWPFPIDRLRPLFVITIMRWFGICGPPCWRVQFIVVQTDVIEVGTTRTSNLLDLFPRGFRVEDVQPRPSLRPHTRWCRCSNQSPRTCHQTDHSVYPGC